MQHDSLGELASRQNSRDFIGIGLCIVGGILAAVAFNLIDDEPTPAAVTHQIAQNSDDIIYVDIVDVSGKGINFQYGANSKDHRDLILQCFVTHKSLKELTETIELLKRNGYEPLLLLRKPSYATDK